MVNNILQLTMNITDVLNKDLKNSCRWWASFDLFRRLLFFLVVLLFDYLMPAYRQVGLQNAKVLRNVLITLISVGAFLFWHLRVLCFRLCPALHEKESQHQ